MISIFNKTIFVGLLIILCPVCAICSAFSDKPVNYQSSDTPLLPPLPTWNRGKMNIKYYTELFRGGPHIEEVYADASEKKIVTIRPPYKANDIDMPGSVYENWFDKNGILNYSNEYRLQKNSQYNLLYIPYELRNYIENNEPSYRHEYRYDPIMQTSYCRQFDISIAGESRLLFEYEYNIYAKLVGLSSFDLEANWFYSHFIYMYPLQKYIQVNYKDAQELVRKPGVRESIYANDMALCAVSSFHYAIPFFAAVTAAMYLPQRIPIPAANQLLLRRGLFIFATASVILFLENVMPYCSSMLTKTWSFNIAAEQDDSQLVASL